MFFGPINGNSVAFEVSLNFILKFVVSQVDKKERKKYEQKCIKIKNKVFLIKYSWDNNNDEVMIMTVST